MRKGPGALSGAMQWPLGLAGGGAHNHESRIDASLQAVDLRAESSPVSSAGHERNFSPCVRGAFLRVAGRDCMRSPVRFGALATPAAGALLKWRAGGGFSPNFFVSRPKPGSYPTDDGTKFLHAHEHGATDVQGVGKGFQDG